MPQGQLNLAALPLPSAKPPLAGDPASVETSPIYLWDFSNHNIYVNTLRCYLSNSLVTPLTNKYGASFLINCNSSGEIKTCCSCHTISMCSSAISSKSSNSSCIRENFNFYFEIFRFFLIYFLFILFINFLLAKYAPEDDIFEILLLPWLVT